MTPTTSVLVVGATGNQGGAVVDHLLASDHDFDVRGLTRNVEGDAARALSERGVTMVEGDLYDRDSLDAAVAGVDAVFAVTNFWTEGYDGQVQQGKNVADAAAAEGVGHVVFSGVGGHDEDTGIPHFDAPNEVDEYIRELDLPWTMLQPVFFFENLEAFAEDVVEDGQLAFPLEAGVSLQMVSHDDVGRAAAVAFADRDAFVGERYDLAGDELTLSETAALLSEVTGRDVEPIHVPVADAYDSFGEEFAIMCEWFNDVGYSADIPALEETFGFEFTRLETYLRDNGWTDKQGMANVPGWVKAMQAQ